MSNFGKLVGMDDIEVVALVGMPGAGKSFCSDYLIDKGFPSVYFGGITVEEVKKRGLEVNEKNEKLVREDLRAKEGPAVMADRIIAKIEELHKQGHKKIVADGLYSWSEYKVFKDKFGDKAIIIAIASPRKIRHQRLANRKIRPLSDKDITAREYAEIENIEKGGPIANADYTIVNDGPPEKIIRELERVLQEIGFKQ